MTRLQWTVTPNLAPNREVSDFEKAIVERWLLDWSPPIIAAAMRKVTVRDLVGVVGGSLVGGMINGFEVLMDDGLFIDPTGIYQFQTPTAASSRVAVHEGIGHALLNYGFTKGEAYEKRFPWNDLYTVSYDHQNNHGVTVEGFCELTQIALTRPAVFKARIPNSVPIFTALWKEVTGGWPYAPDWKLGAASYFTYHPMSGFYDDDATIVERTPVGLAAQQNWDALWVWEHAGLPKWMGYRAGTDFLPGAKAPIAEGAVCYRVADIPTPNAIAALRASRVRAWRTRRGPPGPPPAGLLPS